MPARKVELAKVAPDIKDYLKSQQLQKRQQDLQDYMQKLKKDFNVEVLDESLKITNTSTSEPPSIVAPASKAPKPSDK
jgi:hypothetical protein